MTRAAPQKQTMSLYTRTGARKYLNSDERQQFLIAALQASPTTKSFALTLACTGCRISEALELTAASFQLSSGIVSIRSLKKRGAFAVREVPISPFLTDTLEDVHNISAHQTGEHHHKPLWSWQRVYAWRQIKQIMHTAGIQGEQATAKGLRHGFAIHAIQSGVSINLVQRWLGHASLATTAIYTEAVGPEERLIAARMWQFESQMQEINQPNNLLRNAL